MHNCTIIIYLFLKKVLLLLPVLWLKALDQELGINFRGKRGKRLVTYPPPPQICSVIIPVLLPLTFQGEEEKQRKEEREEREKEEARQTPQSRTSRTRCSTHRRWGRWATITVTPTSSLWQLSSYIEIIKFFVLSVFWILSVLYSMNLIICNHIIMQIEFAYSVLLYKRMLIINFYKN